MTPALLSSLCWAILDVLRKRLAGQVEPIPLAAALMAGQVPLMLVWAWSSGAGLPAPDYLRAGAPLVFTNILAPVTFAAALRSGQLSLTLPMLSFTPVWSALLAFVLAGERPEPRQWLGIALVVAGALLLHAARGGLSLIAMLKDKGVRLMIVVSFIFSMNITLDKLALAHTVRPIHAAVQCSGAALGLLLFLTARRQLAGLARLRPVLPIWVLAVVCFGGATALQLLALQSIPISVVEATKRAIGMLAALIAGRLAFGEPITPGKIAGAAVMAAGVWFIVLS